MVLFFPSSSCAPECRDSHEGSFEDTNGEFAVFYKYTEDTGWFWKPAGGYEEGPYNSSREAYEAAVNLDFSINHKD